MVIELNALQLQRVNAISLEITSLRCLWVIAIFFYKNEKSSYIPDAWLYILKWWLRSASLFSESGKKDTSSIYSPAFPISSTLAL
mmetsp:Transcript_2538/g.4282  ORF Transcript_2538/g.4282 Transcript_2538/m.4282 type:complete len:85 (+) Transcript_2538:247-501(+)